jgi:anti-sigma regulatory factor (Ser/Thr protein kinase)
MEMLWQGACSPESERTRAELCVTVPASPAAGATLRQAVRSLESYFGPGQAEEVELLVTELATNGVKHAVGEEAPRITLDATVEDQCLHVAVQDRGAGFTPAPRSPARSEPGGWGLMLVESIADRWGVEREPTTVWFELEKARQAA